MFTDWSPETQSFWALDEVVKVVEEPGCARIANEIAWHLVRSCLEAHFQGVWLSWASA